MHTALSPDAPPLSPMTALCSQAGAETVMPSKGPSYKVRSASQGTYSVYDAKGRFYQVANGEDHAKRLVDSLKRDKPRKARTV